MTSLLPLLPDTPRLPAADALAGGPAATPVPAAGTPDFAVLLETLAAPAPAIPSAVLPVAVALPAGIAPETAPGVEGVPPQPPVPRAEASPASALAGWPSGKILPEPGALLPSVLPPALPPAGSGAEPPAPAPAPSPAAPPSAATALSPLSGLVAVPRARVAGDAAAPEAPKQPDALPAIALPPQPGDHVAVGSLAPAAPVRAAVPEAAPGEESLLAAAPDEDAEPAEVPAVVLDPAIAPQPLAAGLPFAPVLQGDSETAAPAPPSPPATAPATVAAALPVPNTPRALAIRLLPAAPKPATAGAAPTEPVAAPASPLAHTRAPDAGAADTAPAPALAAEPVLATTSAAGALPDSADIAPAAPAASTPSANLAPAQSPLSATLLPERPADPRGASLPPAAAQLESTIAQVGDIREALRNARPAMTLTHAEFGAVSLRLEPAAPDQWRAVLASRDPGFVPAIHAALETRTIAAAADASANFAGQSGAHHNGTSDQRYGSSPNGGQGSPQPYLGQSGTRDGEAAPDHRRPSTAAALAARGEGEADDPTALARDTGGLFA